MAKQAGKDKKAKTLEELMHKHISDKDDVISDDDFKNMDLGGHAGNEENKPLARPENEKGQKAGDRS